MDTNNDGINTDLRAHPDVYIPRDGIFEDDDKSNYLINISDDIDTRTRSNSGSMFESASGITSGQPQSTSSMMSQSYGGDRGSFLLRQGKLSPASRRYRNHTAGNRVTIPGMSNISYSGYLYKRSNHPHRNVADFHDQKSVYNIDPTRVPELPVMPGVAVTPSPGNNISTETAESEEPIILHQQSALSPPRLADLKKNDAKNSLQMGLELGAAFFGIEIKKNGHNDDNSEVRSDQLGGMHSALMDTNISEANIGTQPGGLPTTRTARRPIPTNTGSSSHLDQSLSSYHEAIHQQQSATTMLSESPSSSGLFNSNSSSGRYIVGNTSIPQDFYDPKDGHLWRAKFCVLEDGILYFYKHASDGNSAEAAAERKKNKYDQSNNNDFQSSSYNSYAVMVDSRGSSTVNPSSNIRIADPGQSTSFSALNSSAAIKSRRRSSAKDLSKSPMVRPGLHPLASGGALSSDIDTYIWEKRVFMDCVGGVRTAEQQYGQNSFELLATDDDESDQNFIDTLVLKGQNPTEMKEWIFQFHRSLASFMRNFIEGVGSTSGAGPFSESHNSSNMLSSSHSSRHLSSSSLKESGSIHQSSSEKHLHRLMSTSPSLQQTLSHGHGRTALKRRWTIKRVPSDSASLSSTPDLGDMDYGHHLFAFREPSPSNLESSSPPLRVLIPPPIQGFIPATNRGNFESMASARTTAPSLASSPPSKTAEILRSKPSTSSSKYIPPHQRSKSKYVPPHLRRQQDEPSLGNNDATSIPPSVRKSPRNNGETQEGCSDFSLIERSQFSPINHPTGKYLSHAMPKETPDLLDIVNPSTTGFVRGGCADPLLVQGSIMDQVYIPKKASRLNKTAAKAYGSYGGSLSDNTKKSNSSLRWEIGAISECGIRESNEDSYLIANDLLTAFESSSYRTQSPTVWKEEETDHSVGLFGIFDGHCGNQGARFAVEKLARFIYDELRFESIEDPNHGNNNDTSLLSPLKMESILRAAIVKLDLAFCNLCQEDGREWESGSTAVVAMLANENLVIASLGDCRGFLCRFVDDTESYVSDDNWEQLEMDMDDLTSSERSGNSEPLQRCFWREVTTVHSPSADKELTRIKNAHGWITTETEIPIGQLRRMDFDDEDVIGILKRCLRHPSGNASFTDSERSTKECKAAPQRIIHISRVCGELAVSRALGDRDFKADFNGASTQRNDSNNFETNEDSSHDDSLLWESPLFLPYPENHNRKFRGDLVTNTPDFHRIRLGTEGVSNEFLLLACDGLWDVMDADDAIRVVRDLLFHKNVTAKKAAARLAELAIHLGSSDNVTVILIRLFSRDDVELKE